MEPNIMFVVVASNAEATTQRNGLDQIYCCLRESLAVSAKKGHRSLTGCRRIGWMDDFL